MHVVIALAIVEGSHEAIVLEVIADLATNAFSAARFSSSNDIGWESLCAPCFDDGTFGPSAGPPPIPIRINGHWSQVCCLSCIVAL